MSRPGNVLFRAVFPMGAAMIAYALYVVLYVAQVSWIPRALVWGAVGGFIALKGLTDWPFRSLRLLVRRSLNPLWTLSLVPIGSLCLGVGGSRRCLSLVWERGCGVWDSK